MEALNMSTELEALRSKHDDDIVKLEQVQQREAELTEAVGWRKRGDTGAKRGGAGRMRPRPADLASF